MLTISGVQPSPIRCTAIRPARGIEAMSNRNCIWSLAAGALTLAAFVVVPARAQELLCLGPEETVRDGGVDLLMPSDSAAIYTHWNEDGLKDLVVSNGLASIPTMVRVYLNVGSLAEPRFSGFFYAQANGVDISEPPST